MLCSIIITLMIIFPGAENVEKYWLASSEVTTVDYDGVTKLWKSIVPLYQKLRQHLATHIASKFGSEVFANLKLIPVHVLGNAFHSKL